MWKRLIPAFLLIIAFIASLSLVFRDDFNALAKSKSFFSQGKVAEETLRQSAKEVLADLAQIRGLKPLAPVEVRLSDRAEIKAFVMDRFKRENVMDKLKASQKSLAKFGLIPASMHLERYLTDLYTDQIGGYYDQHKKVLYLADWIPAQLLKAVMAHELTHALQDQHFNLSLLINPLVDTNDVRLAKMALVEGEGTAVMLEYLLKPQGISINDFPDLKLLIQGEMKYLLTQIQISKLEEIPNVIKENLFFPYIYGISFIQSARKNRTWEGVSAIYQDLPVSTEQIMHPEKYLTNRDNPVAVNLTPTMVREAIGSDWKVVDQDTLGEFNTYVLLKEFIDEIEAIWASEGWGGDRYLLLENQFNGNLALIFLSIWDDEKESEEFFQSAKKLMEKKYNQAYPPPVSKNSGKTYVGIFQKGSDLWLQRKDNSVLLIEGLPENSLIALAKKLL